MIRYIFFVIVFIYSSFSFGQNFWKSGYIILNAGDTVRGLIKDEQWTKNPTHFSFKTQENSEVIEYDNKQVAGFYTSLGITYVSHQFKFDGDLLGQKISYPMGPTAGYPRTRMPVKWIEYSCFMELVLKGTYSLLKYTDDDDREHFFILTPEQQNPEELQYHIYLPYENSNVQSTSEYFKYQFQQLTKDCPDLNNRILKTRYKEPELITMVKLVNECKGGKVEVTTQDRGKRKILVGLLAFGYMNWFSDLPGSKVTGPYPGGGISFELFSRRRPDRQSLYNEFKVSSLNNPNAHFSPQFLNVRISYTSIKLATMFRQYFTNSKLYFDIGIINGYLVNVEMEKNTNFPSKFFESGLALGSGLNFSRINTTAELRFELHSPLTGNSNNSFGVTNTLGLVVSKRFKVTK